MQAAREPTFTDQDIKGLRQLLDRGYSKGLIQKEVVESASSDSDGEVYKEKRFNEDDEKANNYYALPLDSWGTAVMVIILDTPRIAAGNANIHNYSRFVFTLGLLVFNLSFQIYFMYYVWMFVVRPAVHHLQNFYGEYHTQMFHSDGQFIDTPGAWDNFQYQVDLCKAAIARPEFLKPVLLMWTLRMTQEWRETVRIARHFWNCKVKSADGNWIKHSEMVRENTDTGTFDQFGKYVVVGLTPMVSCLIVMFVVLPKALINLALLFFGCRWLTSTASFADLILNMLALEFVVNIDELLYASACPEIMGQLVSHMRIENPQSKTDQDQDMTKQKFHMGPDILRSLGYVLVSVGWVFLYTFVIQSVIPHYNGDIDHACLPYWAKIGQLKCGFTGLIGSSSDCFPFGGNISAVVSVPVLPSYSPSLSPTLRAAVGNMSAVVGNGLLGFGNASAAV